MTIKRKETLNETDFNYIDGVERKIIVIVNL